MVRNAKAFVAALLRLPEWVISPGVDGLQATLEIKEGMPGRQVLLFLNKEQTLELHSHLGQKIREADW